MKTLYLVRHAKSSWEDPSLSDFDRPLNKRGKRDAPKMAQRLIDKGITFEKVYSSPAKRAKSTAIKMCEMMGVEDVIEFKDSLYDAMLNDFISVIESTPDKYEHIALFSHNPTINNFVFHFFNNFHQNIPTCGIFAIELHDDKWKNFSKAEKHRLFYHYPKEDQ